MKETATERHHREFAEAQDKVNAEGGMMADGARLMRLPPYQPEPQSTCMLDKLRKAGL